MKRLLSLSLILCLSACGGDAPDGSATSGSKDSGSARSSELNVYLSESEICNALSGDDLAALSDGAENIQQRAESYRENYSCIYSWPRADAAEREKGMLAATMASMTGKGPKLSLRDRMLEHQVTISLQKSKRPLSNFVPRKLSEAEIEAQIETAKKRTDERLTDEQKAVAGDAANSMVERLLRKNNENETVAGVGDAAYWSNIGTGSLEVLDGDVHMSVAPMMTNSKEEDMQKAKEVAQMLLEGS